MPHPPSFRVRAALVCSLVFAVGAFDAAAAGRAFEVRLDPAASAQPVSGRLLLFAISVEQARANAAEEAKAKAAAQAAGAKTERGTSKPAKAAPAPIADVDTSPFKPTQVSVAAMEVTQFAPGKAVSIDADAIAFPKSFSALPDGDYFVQAVLDVNHDYNYTGRGPGDLVSEPVAMHLGGKKPLPVLSLVRTTPAGTGDPWQLPERVPQAFRDGAPAARANTTRIAFDSPALSAFWGRPMQVRGWVLVPPGYASHPKQRYPVVYETHGFGGTLDRLTPSVVLADVLMRSGDAPEMIHVFLDESSATGTHEFADSVNNGPWGTALTTELIPSLEKQYRMDAKPSGRFLTGHSSGGWATLWLQVRYPKVFGGTWSTSPDPSDFHDFTGPDIYAANANVYRKADGTPWPLVRDKGQVIATFEQFARLERVIGPYGGQMASFDWVFSPRGADGRPMPMFDRDTGAVDPMVAGYWRDHYDIAHRLQTHWPALKPDLDGRIHVIVGDADTFYLDGAAHKLKAVLDGLGAKSSVRFLPGKTHFDLGAQGDDPVALNKIIAREMYAVARPGEAKTKAATATASPAK